MLDLSILVQFRKIKFFQPLQSHNKCFFPPCLVLLNTNTVTWIQSRLTHRADTQHEPFDHRTARRSCSWWERIGPVVVKWGLRRFRRTSPSDQASCKLPCWHSTHTEPQMQIRPTSQLSLDRQSSSESRHLPTRKPQFEMSGYENIVSVYNNEYLRCHGHRSEPETIFQVKHSVFIRIITLVQFGIVFETGGAPTVTHPKQKAAYPSTRNYYFNWK